MPDQDTLEPWAPLTVPPLRPLALPGPRARGEEACGSWEEEVGQAGHGGQGGECQRKESWARPSPEGLAGHLGVGRALADRLGGGRRPSPVSASPPGLLLPHRRVTVKLGGPLGAEGGPVPSVLAVAELSLQAGRLWSECWLSLPLPQVDVYLAKSLAEKLYLFQVMWDLGVEEERWWECSAGRSPEPETSECDGTALAALVGLNSLISKMRRQLGQEAEAWSC